MPLLPGTDDEDDRTTISSRSSSSTFTSAAQAAKLKRILSGKKLEQLRRAKARKTKEELLRLDNEIAAAEDAVELAKIKDRFYGEQIGVLLLLMVVICKILRVMSPLNSVILK